MICCLAMLTFSVIAASSASVSVSGTVTYIPLLMYMDYKTDVLDVNITDINPTTKESNSIVKTFIITNVDTEKSINSNQPQVYEMYVEHTTNLPLIYTLEYTGTNGVGTAITDFENYNSSIVSKQNGKMPAIEGNTGASEHTYKLTISWKSGEDASKYSEEIDRIEICVKSIQDIEDTLPITATFKVGDTTTNFTSGQLIAPISNLAPGATQACTLSISNTHDNAIKYRILVYDKNNLPLEYTLTGNSINWTEETAKDCYVQQNSNSNQTYTLNIKWSTTGDYKNYNLADEIDLITIVIDAEEVV